MNQLRCVPVDCHLVDDGDFPLFASRKWLQVYQDLLGYRVFYLKVEQNGIPVAWLPVYQKNRYGLKQWQLPPYAYYQPLIMAADKESADYLDIQHCLARYIGRNFSTARFNCHWQTLDVRGFMWGGLRATPCYTQLFYLAQFDPERLESRLRTTLRKAEKLGYYVEEGCDWDWFAAKDAEFWQKLGRAAPLDQATTARFFDRLDQNGYLLCHRAMLNGVMTAVSITGVKPGTTTGYAMALAVDEAHKTSGVNTLVIANSLQQMKTKLTNWDYLGMNVPNVARFKARFGGELTVFYRMEKALINLPDRIKRFV